MDLPDYNSTLAKHARMVAALIKDGALLLSQLKPEDVDLWHMGTGIVGEAGELIDAIKKAVVYRTDIDRVNVIEELGDIEFYLEGVRRNLDISREETLLSNMDKLAVRYEKFIYQDQAAIQRADKV